MRFGNEIRDSINAVMFPLIAASNNGVPLKLGLRVIQSHLKWQHSIDYLYGFLLNCHCKYSSVLHQVQYT